MYAIRSYYAAAKDGHGGYEFASDSNKVSAAIENILKNIVADRNNFV